MTSNKTMTFGIMDIYPGGSKYWSHLRSIGIPVVDWGGPYDPLIFSTGYPMPVREPLQTGEHNVIIHHSARDLLQVLLVRCFSLWTHKAAIRAEILHGLQGVGCWLVALYKSHHHHGILWPAQVKLLSLKPGPRLTLQSSKLSGACMLQSIYHTK